MATTMISWNKLLIYRGKNKKLNDYFMTTKQGETKKPKTDFLIGAGDYKATV